jgi:regulator of sigma E protease
MTAFSYLFAFVAMLGVLVFVHEFGHFVAAKLCGVRVLKFSLGFGPTIGIGRWKLAWTRGGTEYVIAFFPLGGFVKMLGENPDEIEGDPEVRAHPSETLGAKPVWQKLTIIFAGPLMNLLLPVVVFMGTLFVGIPRPLPVVGTVEPGSPAAHAGLQPGDRILAIDHKPVAWWDDVEEALRARPGQSVGLAFERDGTRHEISLALAERSGLDEFGGVHRVGWSGLGHQRLRATIGIPDKGSPAAEAGLRSGDRVLRLDGAAVEDWVGLQRAYAQAGTRGSVELAIARGDDAKPEQLSLRVPARGSLDALGVLPASVLVSRVSPDSPAARAGIEPGDLILGVDGEPVGSFASFAEIVRTSKGRTLGIELASHGETRVLRIAPELASADTGLGVPEERYLIGVTAEAAAMVGALGKDVERNPMVSFPRAISMTADVTRTFLQGLGKIVTGQVSSRQLAGPIGIAEIAHSALQRGWEAYLGTLVLISINLGVLNLLPIPVLDGGQAMIFLIEGVKRSPVSLRTREVVQQIGLTVLVLLMGFAFWNDVSRHWSKLLEWLRTSTGL